MRKIPWVFLVGAVISVSLGIGFLWGRHWAPKLLTRTAEQTTAVPDRVTVLKDGPWGVMESMPISIQPPEEYLSTRLLQTADRRWYFIGCSTEQLSAMFRSADLSSEQQAQLLDQSKWEQAGDKTVLAPSKELILSLSPQARKRIYGILANNPDNLISQIRYSFPTERFNTIFDESGLPAETVALIKRLSFPHGRLIFFCDAPLILDTLETYEQKVCLLKTLARRETLLLKLHVMPDSDVHSLMNYWAKASWGKDVKPMLESLAKVPGGARIGVVHLLPPLPTESLYTYPFPSTNPTDLRKDCHWTAMNFFRDTPDPSFTNAGVIREKIQKDYYPVLSDPRFGDIIMLARQDGTVIHSSVFIADDIVYTKNSASYMDPFLLMKLPEMIEYFEAFIPENERLKTLIFRSK